MKIVKEFARYAVGALFIFSGLIKLNDPTGTAIKLEEYFQVFSQDIAGFFEIFIPAALFLSVLLSVLEVVLGIALILAYRMQVTAWLLLLIIVFFTGLTFYSAYFNKVTDCGCFGDAIKLTPWQSFYKDIILLGLIVVIFIRRNAYDPFLKTRLLDIIMGATTAVCVLVALLAIWYLPFIDFRHYAVGNDLKTLMQPEEPAQYDYVMEKDGKEYRFQEYPTDDSYTYKEAVVLNPKKSQPKIPDFGVWQEGTEKTREVLTGAKMLFIFHDLDKANTSYLEEMKNLAEVSGLETWAISSSGYETSEPFRHKHQIPLPFYTADATVLKAMIRSNPGVMVLKDGIVMGKWHHNALPNSAEVRALAQ